MPKNVVGEHFRGSLILGIEKFCVSEVYVTIFDFRSKFFCLTLPKMFFGEPAVLCFRKLPVAKKFIDKRGGGIKIFRRKFYVSQCRNFS